MLNIQSIIKNAPKIELHFHLEGAIPLPALWKLMQKYGGDPEVKTFDQLQDKFTFKDFAHFLDTWIWKNNFIREYDDFTFIAEEVAKDLIKQNIVYVESFYSPGRFTLIGMDIQEITKAIRKGLDKYKDRVEVKLIIDLVRDLGPEMGKEWLQNAIEVKSEGIIGIGIGGSEQSFPPEPYKEVYELARSHGLKTMAHAGEVAGPESVWGAVKTLRVDRIGHGTHAIKDKELISYIKKHKIPIELCPISNLRTKSITEMKDHPVRKYFDSGLILSINTDDPKMFNNTLEDEYLNLINNFQFSLYEINTIMESAITSAWCPDAQKQELKVKLNQYWDSI
jgi:adenosine deaminase